VYFKQPVINFKSVLVGMQSRETVTLINDENLPFSFSFSDSLIDQNENRAPVMKFTPSSGIVPPNSQLNVEVIFTPTLEKVFNLNLFCNIKKKSAPLKINVKGEGYQIHEILQYELPNGNILDLASGGDNENILDFGEVQLNERRVKRVYLINSGKFNFDYEWKGIPKKSGLSIIPEIGSVAKDSKSYCEIMYMPTVTSKLKDTKISCHVINGATYQLTVMGSASRPQILLSPRELDFKTQFVCRSGLAPTVLNLDITNNDSREITLDVISPEVEWYEISRNSITLKQYEKIAFPVVFKPTEEISYSDKIKFDVNGHTTLEFPIIGEGAELKIEAEQKILNLGGIKVGSSIHKRVKISNKSKLPVSFNFSPNSISGFNDLGFLFSIPGSGEGLLLDPKESYNLDFKFAPNFRIPPFSEELDIEVSGAIRPLMIITGACQGTEVRLESELLPFGAVVKKSSSTRRIQLQNVGDIGARFSWDSDAMVPWFTIAPNDGYLAPGMEMSLEVTFHPSEISNDVRCDRVKCNIEGSSPQFLSLTGICIPQPVQTDAVKFNTAVRSPDVKSITLSNRTIYSWHIQPIIENDYWSGNTTIDVEPGQSKQYDLTFLPLETIGQGEAGRHEGSIFFPLPDGSGIMYKLIGVAENPLAQENITKDVISKTLVSESLLVYNWSRKNQKFKVIFEQSKPDSTVVIKGHDFIDVPALLTKEYKFTYYTYKEGVNNFKVTFKNETTQEYIFYNLTYKGLPAGIIDNIEMTTSVRVCKLRDILISNPLTLPATFSATSSATDLHVPHSFCIPAK
jgi:hydrocephalus-inducing protein